MLPMIRHLLILALAGAAASVAHAEAPSTFTLEELIGEDAASLLQQQLFLQEGVFQTDEHRKDAAPSHRAQRTDPEPRPSAAEASGIKLNGEGDLGIFLTGLFVYGTAAAGLVAVFMVVKDLYPMIYSNNVLTGAAPCTPPATRFGWALAAWTTTTEQAEGSVGLDCALLLEFSDLCMRILATIGIPMVCVMGPLHFFFGGHAAGLDRLSYFSMGNVQSGAGSSTFVYWVHGLVVWVVGCAVEHFVYGAMERFLKLRYRWLREQPEPRCTTILVENIPEKYRSDAMLKSFFDTMFDGAVKDAYVVKYTLALEAAIARQEAAKDALQKATARNEMAIIEFCELEAEAAGAQIREERAKVIEKAAEVGGINCANGFVTFKDRSSAEVAKIISIGPHAKEWVVSSPPAPASVVWSGLQQDSKLRLGRTLIGYALVAGLYIVYLPAVVWITNIANAINMGFLQPIWASIAPTAGLQFMVAFLPTFLIWIFRLFFVGVWHGEVMEQHELQKTYFIFQVVFVVMVPAIGSNVVAFTKAVLSITCTPMETLTLIGGSIPQATHFFMNFMVLQWMTHCTNLVRWVQLFKFRALSAIWEEEQARQLAEPEDQDYYGIGSRSARFATSMIIAIVYGSMCPWIYLLTFINFFVCRIVYGYLIPFAETRKGDLGGDFFVTQLKHVLVGVLIYAGVMTGVLYGRAASSGPALVAGAALVYLAWSMYRFLRTFTWEVLPFEEIKTGELKTERGGGAGAGYVQPCMLEE